VIPRLFVASALTANAEIVLGAKEAHYIARVLRRRAGDNLILFNGRDGEYWAHIAAIEKSSLHLRLSRQRRAQTDERALWLLAGLVQRPALETIVAKACELGVTTICPVITRHAGPHRVNLDRLRTIATESAEQSERLSVPEIVPPVMLENLFEAWPASRPVLLCAESGPALSLAEAIDSLSGNEAALLTGPEGGFPQMELDFLRKLPFVTSVTLGPRILRADTAAIAALAVIQALWGDGAARPLRDIPDPEQE
jgi:16S rRNA (uracil1498-N3)-methyltransferase